MKYHYLILLLALLSSYSYGQPEKFVLQAEDAEYGGGCEVASRNNGFNGSGYIGFPGNGGYVNFTGIDGGEGGNATLLIRWALGNDSRTGELVVNGEAFPLTLDNTGGWAQWDEKYVTIDLEPGTNNSISLRSNGEDFGNLDEITVWEDSWLSCNRDTYIGLDDRWSANYWESNVFEGQVCRVAAQDGSSLYADVDHTYGGWDIALTYNYKNHIRVDDIPAGFTVNGRIETNLTTVDNGLWWAGPKVDIRREGSSGLEGNYENYIIENASISPDAMHERRMGREGAVYLGSAVQDGATYKYYTNPHKEWQQYYAIRQQYRSGGSVSLQPILRVWRANGMRNDYIRNMRMNIEASRNSQGSVAISDFATPLPGQSPPSAESGRILIRARSSQGGEEMVLEVAGEVVKRWDDVSVDPDNYIYDGYRGGEIKIIFDDDGGSRDEGTDRNLGINYIDVCGVRYESNGEGVTRTNCGNDNVKGFAWLYCNGSLNFGDIGCNPSARALTNASKAPALSQEPLAAFKTYPNPVSERLTIAGGEDYQVTLYDMAGRRMMQHDHLTGKAELDIRHLRPGVYLIKLRDDQQHEVRQRIIIE